MAITTSALNLPGVPVEFTEDDAVISAISGELLFCWKEEKKQRGLVYTKYCVENIVVIFKEP